MASGVCQFARLFCLMIEETHRHEKDSGETERKHRDGPFSEPSFRGRSVSSGSWLPLLLLLFFSGLLAVRDDGRPAVERKQVATDVSNGMCAGIGHRWRDGTGEKSGRGQRGASARDQESVVESAWLNGGSLLAASVGRDTRFYSSRIIRGKERKRHCLLHFPLPQARMARRGAVAHLAWAT